MVLNGIEDDFSTFYTCNFLPFHFYSILKIFDSILNFSSIFHSIIPYQGKFKPEAKHNLYCTFATLSVLLQVVAHEGKQYGTTHLIPYLKHYSNDLPKRSLSIKISIIGLAKIFDWRGAKSKLQAMTTSDVFKRWDFYGTEIPQNGRSEAEACVCGTYP